MTLEDMQNRLGCWLDGSGPNPEIVMSTRVRLARNLKERRFSHRAEKDELQQILTEVTTAVEETQALGESTVISIREISEEDRRFLLERHLVSNELVSSDWPTAVIVGDDECRSVMVNEEDHLRIQVMQSGFQPGATWVMAEEIESCLESRLEYAFSDQYGYLTACPTNAGTGLRISVLLHLPGLGLTGQIGRALKGIAQVGLAVRGLYGEGTEAMGNFFQVSNQTTLGQSEPDIIGSLERVTRQVIEHEGTARRILLKDAKPQIEDKVWRAFGLLRSGRLMRPDEVLNLCSAVRMGLGLGLLSGVSCSLINSLMVLSQPAHIERIAGKSLSESESNAARADLVRKLLQNCNAC
ncbi:MAG: protein arginine kinase [Candidatus Eisenbacteria sp.]|nr:protein arginine kinase [Candidatus Eisenbacteria bacterium]